MKNNNYNLDIELISQRHAWANRAERNALEEAEAVRKAESLKYRTKKKKEEEILRMVQKRVAEIEETNDYCAEDPRIDVLEMIRNRKKAEA